MLGTPSVGSISNLATRADEFRTSTIRRCPSPLAPVRVPRCGSPRPGLSHRLTLPRPVGARLSASPPRNGEDASHRLLQLRNFTTRAPARTVRLPRWTRTLSRPPPRPLEPKPHRTARVAALFDVAPPASTCSTTRPSSSDEGAGAGCSWWHPRSRDPSDGAPSRRRFRPRARRKNEPLTLPVATPRGRDLDDAARTASAAPSSKGAGFPARSAFPRRVARSAFAFATASNADPPPDPGFCHPRPASDALSPFATMRKD